MAWSELDRRSWRSGIPKAWFARLALITAAAPILCLVAGCTESLEQRRNTALSIAARAGLTAITLQAGAFHIQSFLRVGVPGQPIAVYVEGDGLAWTSRTTQSPDPTPVTPVGLELAALDPSANVAYLSRPCQYGGVAVDLACQPPVWGRARFSEAVIAAIDDAMGQIVAQSGARAINIVGYSGGGAVAVLVASRRSDVQSLRTVAGLLDTDVFAVIHDVTRLSESLNPAERAPRIATIAQSHFIGGADQIIPRAIVDSYLRQLGSTYCADVRVFPQIGHNGNWPELWASLKPEIIPTCR